MQGRHNGVGGRSHRLPHRQQLMLGQHKQSPILVYGVPGECSAEPGDDIRVVFQGGEGFQLCEDKRDVKFCALPGADSINVEPIAFAGSKCFVNDQILGGAGFEGVAFAVFPIRGARDGALFEINGTERDIQVHTVGCPDEKNPVSAGKIFGIGPSGNEFAEEKGNGPIIIRKVGEERRVSVAGHAWLSPSLDSKAADKAIHEPFGEKLPLQLLGGSKNPVNGHGAWKTSAVVRPVPVPRIAPASARPSPGMCPGR